MDRVAIFVDGANMFYAQQENQWHIDYKKVYNFFKKEYDISVAYYFTGTPHYADTVKVKEYRGFKNSLIYIGYTVIEKELKVIKPKLPDFVLINEKPVDKIIKGELYKGKIPKEGLLINNADVRIKYKDKRKADLDVNITLNMLSSIDHYDVAVFMGGDSDFEPLLSYLRNNGKYIIILGKKEMTATELINICHKFINLHDIRANIEKGELI